jgi:hypothetical protein
MPDAPSQAKTDRLKAALRENLKRRKAQARGRKATPEGQPGDGPEPGEPPERRST